MTMIWATVAIVAALLLVAAARAHWGQTAYTDGALAVLGVAIIALAIPGAQQTWLRVAEVALGIATIVIAGVAAVRRVRSART